MSKRRSVKCDCGTVFKTADEFSTLCPECLDAVERDCNVEMFGADADYLEHAGLADQIGNK